MGMEERDEKVLRLAARYRLVTRAAVQAAVMGGVDPTNVLKRLMAERRYLTSEGRKLPGNVSYYQLTEVGAQALREATKARGLSCAVPIEAGAPPAAQELQDRIATLWFSTMGGAGKRRLLLESSEVQGLLGDEPPPGLHVIDAAGEWSILYHVYVPAPTTQLDNLLRAAEAHLRAAQQHPTARDWVASKSYGLLILLHNEPKLEAVRRACRKKGLSDAARFQWALAPTPETLKDFLHGHAAPSRSAPRTASQDASTSEGGGS